MAAPLTVQAPRQASPSAPVSPSSDSVGSEERPTPYAWYVAFALTTSYVLSFVDRKLPFILAEPIKHSLHLSDTQIGLITGLMFTLVYSVAAIPVASLADRSSRKLIIGAAILVWSIITSLGGFAQNFWQFSASRAGVAIGEAGITPAAFSMLADYFPPRYRARAVGLYYLGAQTGILLGLPLAGWINDMSNWRLAMIVVGAPGIFFSLLIWITVREPARKAISPTKPAPSPVGIWVGLKEIFSHRTYRHIFLAGTIFNITGGGMLSFSPAYVMRNFHLSTSETGFTYGIMGGAGGALGAMLGGVIGDYLKTKDERWPLWFVAIAISVSMPCVVLAFLSQNYVLFLALLFVPHFAVMTYAGPSFSAIQAVVNPRSTALATAVFLFALNGIGLSVGSYLAGAISDSLGYLGGGASLRWAIIALSTLLLWGAVHFVLAGRALPHDLKARQG
jgi:predicted MFS family arabinose efflux permease